VAVQLHTQNIDLAVQQAMEAADLSFDQLTGVAVTRGPGIGICLDVGLSKAKALVGFILFYLVLVFYILDLLNR
jgi:N6-L-threonylcarbamoyladenine synthase